MRHFDKKALAALGIFMVAAATLVYAHDIGAAIGEVFEAELAGECKVVLVNGQEDHCVVVIPGTDTPVPLRLR